MSLAWPILLMVLVPMVPAYVLFKTLGSKAQMNGREFYGFNIQLGGAFAGYVSLVLILYFIFHPYLHPPSTRLVYRLQGRITDEKQNGIPLSPDNLALVPQPSPMIWTDKNGNFSVSFIVDPDDGGSENFPLIEVSYRDYLPTSLSVDPSGPVSRSQKTLILQRDDQRHIIYTNPIALTKAVSDEVHLVTPTPLNNTLPVMPRDSAHNAATQFQTGLSNVGLTPMPVQTTPLGYGPK